MYYVVMVFRATKKSYMTKFSLAAEFSVGSFVIICLSNPLWLNV